MSLKHVITSYLRNPWRLPQNILWRFPSRVSSRRHVFVVGAPRSGTTLLQSVLAVHPSLSGPDQETAFFMFRDLFVNRWPEVDDQRVNVARRQSSDIVEFYDHFADAYLETHPGSRFLEKTPQHVLRLSFLTRYFPEARFINIVRDGRDCYCSATHHSGIEQGGALVDYARYWARCVSARLALGAHPAIMDIRYEDLTADPEAVIRGVMSFLGEDFVSDQINPAAFSRNKQSQKKEFLKLNEVINSSSQGRWRKEMSLAEQQVFVRIAGRELRAFSYETGSGGNV